MKRHFIILAALTILPLLSGCGLAKSLEEEINVVYQYDNEVLKTDTVTQFKNSLTPVLSDAYIPVDFRFFGWTAYDLRTIRYTDPDFNSKYCDGIVHYMDIKDLANNSTVVMRPLLIAEEDIPKIDYYCVIGWYNKTTTSGLDQNMIDNWTVKLKEYLTSEGATQDELDLIDIRGYGGDVATMGAAINKDGDVNVLLGVGNNITSTGGVETVERSENNIYMGGKTNRVIALLTEDEVSRKVYEWALTDDSLDCFK